MKKIGFIDYYLDEWHANQYPAWIREASDGNMIVAYAYGLKDAANGISNAEWCDKNGVELLSSIEEVVEKSDYLIVLSPDHPEYHLQLAELALGSGKPTYIDKTFAPDRTSALQLFAWAEEAGTPMFSSSALRYATEYSELEKTDIEYISSFGPGTFENYSIHQIEPIVTLMGTDATRIMYVGTPETPALLIGFTNDREALLQNIGSGCPFQAAVKYRSGESKVIQPASDFFQLFIRDLLRFFETGEPSVPKAETVAVVTIIEFGMKAADQPFEWIELPR